MQYSDIKGQEAFLQLPQEDREVLLREHHRRAIEENTIKNASLVRSKISASVETIVDESDPLDRLTGEEWWDNYVYNSD